MTAKWGIKGFFGPVLKVCLVDLVSRPQTRPGPGPNKRPGASALGAKPSYWRIFSILTVRSVVNCLTEQVRLRKPRLSDHVGLAVRYIMLRLLVLPEEGHVRKLLEGFEKRLLQLRRHRMRRADGTKRDQNDALLRRVEDRLEFLNIRQKYIENI